MSSHYVLKIQYVNKPPETRNIGAKVTTIGREAGDIVLGDPQSSGRHAEIHFVEGSIEVRDLGSTNGTFYNGTRSQQFALQPGQGFSIGQTVLTLMAVNLPQDRPGGGKTMIAMGGMPPRPAGAPPFGRPPGAPPGPGAPPPGPPGGYGGPGAPPPGSPPPGGPGGPPPGYGAPPPGGPGGPGGFGGPPPGGPGGPPPGYGAPPPGGPGGPPPGGFAGGPGGPPPSYGAPPPGGPGGPPPGYGAPPPGMSMEHGPMGGPGPSGARGSFSGTGGELIGELIVGYLLTMVTFGIYGPWFFCKFANFIAQRVTFGPTPKGSVRLRFDGEGGDLFVTFILGYLLTVVTLGVYSPWFICKLQKFYTDNLTVLTDSGEEYKPRFDGEGGQLFVTFILGYLLTIVTLGIYAPWFICKMTRWFAQHTKITKGGQDVGGLDFPAEGGDLLVTFIVGYLLTIVTLGIYMAWFQVKLLQFNAAHAKIDIEGKRLGMRFSGQGGELFVIVLVGYLLSIITLGIYVFWFIPKLLQWGLSNLEIFAEGPAGQLSAGMSPGAPIGAGPGMGAMGPGRGYPGQPPMGQLGQAQPMGGPGQPMGGPGQPYGH